MKKILTGIVASALVVSFVIPFSAFAHTTYNQSVSVSNIKKDSVTRTSVSVVSPNGGEKVYAGEKLSLNATAYSTSDTLLAFYLVKNKNKKDKILLTEIKVPAGKNLQKFETVVVVPKETKKGKYHVMAVLQNSKASDVSDKKISVLKYRGASEPTRPTPIPNPGKYNADINFDGKVNVTDLLAVINAWGSCPVVSIADNVRDDSALRIKNPCPADINSDGFVNKTDLDLVIANWHR